LLLFNRINFWWRNLKIEHQLDEECQLSCLEALENLVDRGVVVIDAQGFILDEYMVYCSFEGEPGVGDKFFKHVFDNQHVEGYCLIVSITPRPGQPDNYIEFPNNPSLAGFDRSDRKFVAVSNACPNRPPICNATDSDWADYEAELNNVGIIVEQLCPHYNIR
jgi:hypothetical protein